jgi:hypothetical protein
VAPWVENRIGQPADKESQVVRGGITAAYWTLPSNPKNVNVKGWLGENSLQGKEMFVNVAMYVIGFTGSSACIAKVTTTASLGWHATGTAPKLRETVTGNAYTKTPAGGQNTDTCIQQDVVTVPAQVEWAQPRHLRSQQRQKSREIRSQHSQKLLPPTH